MPWAMQGSSRLAGYEPRAERPASPEVEAAFLHNILSAVQTNPGKSQQGAFGVLRASNIASRICFVCMSATLSGADLTKSCSGIYILRASWRTMRHLTMTWFRFDSAPATVKPQPSSSFVILGGLLPERSHSSLGTQYPCSLCWPDGALYG